ncbi:SWIM zinc finger family protein [Gallaecimonas pentaromativorans]|uniref:SWIM zinc finger family protein n=1 Tax=Gallaecimonas pentaromativorans TaxID=584787 RepID=UPI0009FA7775|nr:DUF6880 family protein [Gallaecimonas pentaromativorans]
MMLNEQQILAEAGSATFAKGMQLLAQNRVMQFTLEAERCTAMVQGSRPYQVQIDLHSGRAFCSCPAAEYQNLCKHGVAVALRLSLANQGVEPANDERAQLRAHFADKAADELVEIVLDCLEQSPHLWQKWLLQVRSAKQPLSVAELKKRLTQALPLRSLWDWDEVRDYFIDAEQQLDILWPVLARLATEDQWTLANHALKRFNLVLERLDDSGGNRFAVEEQLCRQLATVFGRLDWSDQKKAQWLFDNLDNDQDIFPRVPEDFSLSAETQQALGALCEQALQKETKVLKGKTPDFEYTWRMSRYAAPLLALAIQNDDWREQLRIRAMLASQSDDFLALCQLCLAHQAQDEAQAWLDRAYASAKSRHEKNACRHHEVEVKLAFGDSQGAWSLAWQLFTEAPNYEAYQELAKLYGQLGQPSPDFLAQVESCFEQKGGEALLAFYLEQRQLDKAREWTKNHSANSGLLLALSEELLEWHPDEAIALVLKVVKPLIEQTHNDAYQQAILHLSQLQKQLRDQGHSLKPFQDTIEQLADQYRRKRNMLALLKEHF